MEDIFGYILGKLKEMEIITKIVIKSGSEGEKGDIKRIVKGPL